MTEKPSAPPRRRPVTAISGWLLFVCLFLPTLRVCGNPTAPVEFPPTYGVYLGALAIGIAAFSLSLRVRRIVLGLVIGLAVATALTWLVMMTADELRSTVLVLLLVLVGLSATIYVAAAAAKKPWTGRAIAIGWAIHALLASAWNTLLVLDPDHMWGAIVALVASGLMLLDALIAISSESAELRRRREELTLPVARMIERPT